MGLVVLPACGSPTPPPVKTPPPAASAPAPPPVAAPEPDLSPIAAPKNTVAVGRWSNVAATFKTVEKLGKLPFQLQSVLEKELGDKDLMATLKLDASVDAALMIDGSSPVDQPKPMGVLSLPLKDMKEALALANRAGKPVSLRPGVFRLGRNRDFVCDLSVSVGDAPARLLCSENERDLDALVPWMTRGLPTEKFSGSDLHLELRAEGLRQRYKAELDQFGPVLPGLVTQQLNDVGVRNAALQELLVEMAADGPKFVADLDSLSMDIRLDGEKSEIISSGAIRFKSTSSWGARFMTHRNDKAGPPPAIFWMIPKDSNSASFNRGSDPKFFSGVREALSSGVRDLLAGKLDGSDVQNISELLAKVPLVDAQAIVAARGLLPEEASRAVKPADFKPADAIRESQNKLRNLMGWSLLGIESRSDAYSDWLKLLVKTYNNRSLQRTIQKGLGSKSRNLPTVKSVPAPKGSPAGTLAVEFAIPITSKDVWSTYNRLHDNREHPRAEAKGSLSFVVALAPDGNRTWIGISADPKALGERLAVVKEGAPREGTLASRSDLDALKNGTATNGGFVSISGVTGSITGSLSSAFSARERRMVEQVIGSMPNKGATPILITTTGTTDAAPVNSVQVRVQKGSVDDLVAAFTGAFMMRDASTSPVEESAPPPPAPPPPPARKK
jgi:hypothetical protein